jgi:SpoVK/Ycf46/Vps4 family AAA+-type ATPase
MEKLKEIVETAIKDPNASIDKTIAGYEPQKKTIRDKFLAPIKMEKMYEEQYENKKSEYGYSPTEEQVAELNELKLKADNVPIPKAVLFYGCFGTGKTTFAHATATEADCEIVKLRPTSETFADDVDIALKEAQYLYLKTGKRTIIVINEIEDFLNKDIDAFNLKNLVRMKSILDDCSKKPNENDKTACGTTFFFTTNFPQQLMDIGILGRKGKLNIVVPVEPAADEDMQEVLKFHIKRVMPDKRIFDTDNYDYIKLVEKLNPSEKGAYSNDRISYILDDIKENYVNDTSKSFQTHLEEGILENKAASVKFVDISPNRYNEYYDDYEKIGRG